MCIHCEPLIKAIDGYLRKADDKLVSELKAAGFIAPEDTVKEINDLEDKLAESFGDFDKSVMEAVKSSKSLSEFAAEKWPQIRRSKGLIAVINRICRGEFERFIPDMTIRCVTKIDPQLTVAKITRRTTSWIESWSEKLSSLMDLNSKEGIEKILVDGLKKGQGIAEFTQALIDSGIRGGHGSAAEYEKARRIAVTEVLRAHSVAQHESLIQSPAVEERMWRHTGSYRNQPRQNHVDMDGTRVPINEPFILKGADGVTYKPMYPRDSNLPPGECVNCHCIEQGVVSEKILGLSLEERQRLQAKIIAEDDGEWEKELDAKNRAKAGIE